MDHLRLDPPASARKAPHGKSFRPAFAALALLGVCLAAVAVGMRLTDGDKRAPGPRDRYLRAVYVLRSLGGPAAQEAEDIPRRIAVADATESLLHHPDKILVLTHVADELAEVGEEQPKAMLYEAYARLSLGQRKRAAELLTRYVVEDEYNMGHYSLLASTLYDLRDFSSLYLICREWMERDPECSEKRARLTFAALFNLRRFDQALAFARRNSACMGWQAEVRAARAALAVGDEQLADEILQAAVARYPESGDAVMRLWNLIRDKEEL